MSGGTAAAAQEYVRYSWRLGEANVACHIAALPFSILKPGTSLASTLRITKSVVQFRADVYIGQKAVFAATGSGGGSGLAGLAASDSVAGLGDGAQADKARKETAARTAESFLCIPITHSMPTELSMRWRVNSWGP